MAIEEQNKIIAIIQGPVSSPGRTFSTNRMRELGRFNNESDLVIDFNSRSTILENIKKIHDCGIATIYSGWLGDCPPDFKEEIEDMGTKVILSDATNAPSVFEKDTPFKNVLAVANKTKQYYSLFHGLKSIKNLSEHLVIKMRSDMTLDLDKLLTEIYKHRNSLISDSTILIQHLKYQAHSKRLSFWIPDFIFVGRGDVIRHISEDLLIRSLNNDSYSNNPHVDLGNAILRFHWPFFPKFNTDSQSLRKLLKESRLIMLAREIINRTAQLVLREKLSFLQRNRLLIPMSKKVQHSIIWRGDPYAQFAKDNSEVDKELIYSPHD